MKVFITGGTGFVGREILWQLHEAGHRIFLLSRRGPAEDVRQLAYRHRAEIVTGGLESAETLAGLMQGCEAVIHLVGIISEHGRNTFQRAHVETTQTVLSAAARAGVKRYLHMSALGSRPGARSRYHQTKWQAEELVRSSGLAWTIFRPSVIYGRDDGFVNLLAKICRRSPFIPVFGAGTNQLQPVAVEEVARAFVGALSCEPSIGRTYDLCGREVFTMNALYDTILRVMKRRRPKLHLPLPLAGWQAGFMEAACSVVGRPSPLTRDQLLMLEEDNVGDPTAAEADFRLASQSFAEGIAKYIR
jgi:uncharacterized protein YbjT (DUF2867 family)